MSHARAAYLKGRRTEEAISASSTGASFALMPMALASVLRLVTRPKIFQQALRRLCLDKQLAGNGLPDAWLAAAAAHRGERLVTFDRHFRKLLTRSQLTLFVSA